MPNPINVESLIVLWDTTEPAPDDGLNTCQRCLGEGLDDHEDPPTKCPECNGTGVVKDE